MSRALPNQFPNRIQKGLLYGTGKDLSKVIADGPAEDDLPRDIEASEQAATGSAESVQSTGGTSFVFNPRMATMLQVRRDGMKRDR